MTIQQGAGSMKSIIIGIVIALVIVGAIIWKSGILKGFVK